MGKDRANMSGGLEARKLLKCKHLRFGELLRTKAAGVPKSTVAIVRLPLRTRLFSTEPPLGPIVSTAEDCSKLRVIFCILIEDVDDYFYVVVEDVGSKRSRKTIHSPLRQRPGMPSPEPLFFLTCVSQCWRRMPHAR